MVAGAAVEKSTSLYQCGQEAVVILIWCLDRVHMTGEGTAERSTACLSSDQRCPALPCLWKVRKDLGAQALTSCAGHHRSAACTRPLKPDD